MADTNILINLMHVGRLDLLGKLPRFKFVVTRNVVAEIVRPDQKQQIEGALDAAVLRLEDVFDPECLALFAELRRLMGGGEAASLALAATKGWALASDEKRAFRREALARLGQGQILTTPGLYMLAVRSGLLTVEEADADKTRLGLYRFKMGFSSFRDLVSTGPHKPKKR